MEPAGTACRDSLPGGSTYGSPRRGGGGQGARSRAGLSWGLRRDGVVPGDADPPGERHPRPGTLGALSTEDGRPCVAAWNVVP
ncbi:hypothetical protein [Streptomyces sp. NPDC004042]|uniref:hypothetical protein n=1 Tax=Streptomyces sp. NPDC004042 TaxID=3154451 RepID=UPI0033A5453A